MDHTPACASRPEEEWGRLLVEQYEGAPLGVVPLYGGEVWNAAGSRMRLRHIPRCRPGRRQRGMVQQLTNVDVFCNGERLGAPSCQALVWHGDTITFGAAFPRATLVTHIVEINPLFLQLSLTKRPQRPRPLPTSLAPPAGDPPRGPPPTGVKVVLCALVATSPSNSSWAIVAAESYRLASHGPPLHTGLVALRGTFSFFCESSLLRNKPQYPTKGHLYIYIYIYYIYIYLKTDQAAHGTQHATPRHRPLQTVRALERHPAHHKTPR